MLRSLVGSEMCIRDRSATDPYRPLPTLAQIRRHRLCSAERRLLDALPETLRHGVRFARSSISRVIPCCSSVCGVEPSESVQRRNGSRLVSHRRFEPRGEHGTGVLCAKAVYGCTQRNGYPHFYPSTQQEPGVSIASHLARHDPQEHAQVAKDRVILLSLIHI